MLQAGPQRVRPVRDWLRFGNNFSVSVMVRAAPARERPWCCVRVEARRVRRWCGIILVAGWSAAAPAATERGLDVALRSSLAYDDNVFRLSDGVAPATGRTRADWVLTPSAEIGYTGILGPVQARLDAKIGYQFHRRNKLLDRERIDLGANGTTRIVGCEVKLKGSYSRGQSDLADVVVGGDLVNVEDRIGYGANLLCGDAIGLRPGLGYQHVSVDNSDAARSVSDFRADTYTASLGYSRPSFGMLSLYGSYRDGSYPNRPELAPGLGANDRVRVWSSGLTYSREIGTRFSGTASVGYMKVKPKLDAIPGFKGLSYAGELRFHATERLGGSIGFSRSAQQSNLLGISYSIDTRYEGGLSYTLSPRMSLYAQASHLRRRFEASPLVPSPIGGGHDRSSEISGGIKLAAVRRLTLELSGSHLVRKSNVSLLDYDRNRVMLTAGLSF